jgi:Arc/MetJ-type ribon-helix-helix transcriptional regulator
MTHAYGMRETLTISLPEKTKSLIERAAAAGGLTTSEYVRLAIHRKLWSDALAESRLAALPRAREQGVFSDEEVFRLIS